MKSINKKFKNRYGFELTKPIKGFGLWAYTYNHYINCDVPLIDFSSFYNKLKPFEKLYIVHKYMIGFGQLNNRRYK